MKIQIHGVSHGADGYALIYSDDVEWEVNLDSWGRALLSDLLDFADGWCYVASDGALQLWGDTIATLRVG